MSKHSNFKLIVLDSARELGEKTNIALQKIMKTKENFFFPISSLRFSNGEAKACLDEDVRDCDLYILADVGNYSLSYLLHGSPHLMSPDEHFQDIKRVILATSGHASHITVVMPLLYQSRQHKRRAQESLDCACALQELERLHVNEILTFDAHDPNVSNAIPNLPFENVYPTNTILQRILEDNPSDLNELLVISPDMGAMERARYYAEMLNCDVGVFYKRRDLTKTINGKNPILEHVYMGADVMNKTILVVDDMIASGQSMLEVAKLLKEKGAKKIFLVATFALFTEGVSEFFDAYSNKDFQKLYVTNLSYVPEEVKRQKWYEEVDCSYALADIIYHMNTSCALKTKEEEKKEVLEKIETLKC